MKDFLKDYLGTAFLIVVFFAGLSCTLHVANCGALFTRCPNDCAQGATP